MQARTIDDGVQIALGVVALVATAMGTLAVISRYFFALPISFSDELVAYLVVWGLLIGIGVGERENIHIRATLISERLSPGVQLWLARATLLLTVAFGLVMIWFGGLITWQRYALHEVSPTILQFPQWIARICIPVGFPLVVWAAATHLRRPAEAAKEPV